MPSIDEHIDKIIELEGGFTNDLVDRGGPTKYGITLATLSSIKEGATIDDVKNLTREEAKDIFKKLYYYRYGINRLSPQIQPVVLDAVILHGPIALKWAQQAIAKITGRNLEIDGIIGHQTEQASRCVEASAFKRLFSAYRTEAVSKLVRRHPEQGKFLKGWLRRISQYI